MGKSENIIELIDVKKVYDGDTVAVENFNLQVKKGEFVTFLGPSGCGKSTTLRMIAGLEEITYGEVAIDGRIVNNVEPKDRDIAMVFQNYALYPHMTIYENIAFGLRTRKVPKEEIDKRVTEAAETLGITEYLKRKPKEMSGGQRQRVALGRAIVREPKVMLLDEPLSNLDAKLRTQMRSEIIKLHKKLNTTFIYVTHDQVEAMTMGTRIVVMKDGFVKQIDTPKNLYKYPSNKFVAGFIGTPQMNFFQGTLKKDGDKVHIEFKWSEAKITVPYSMLMKTTPQYLDGTKTVYIGFRAEDISLEEDKVRASEAKIKVRISHSEELGTETLVYGDINMDGDGFAETNTRVIIKSAGFKEYKPDTVCEAALNIDSIHLFDIETEESIMPRIPEYNYLDCNVENGKLKFLGNSVDLPESAVCENGSGELLISVSAIKFDGDIKAKVIDNENINGQNLVSLDINGSRIYALSDNVLEKGEIGIGLDFKKLIINVGSVGISPMPLTNGLNGTFVMEKLPETINVKGKDKKVKTPHYYLVINGTKFEAPEQIYSKMFAATTGRKVYNSTYRYEWTPYDFTVSESGIEAQVLKTLDYGAEKFLKCAVGEEILYVKCDKVMSGKIYLVPEVNKVSVIESERQIRIV